MSWNVLQVKSTALLAAQRRQQKMAIIVYQDAQRFAVYTTSSSQGRIDLYMHHGGVVSANIHYQWQLLSFCQEFGVPLQDWQIASPVLSDDDLTPTPEGVQHQPDEPLVFEAGMLILWEGKEERALNVLVGRGTGLAYYQFPQGPLGGKYVLIHLASGRVLFDASHPACASTEEDAQRWLIGTALLLDWRQAMSALLKGRTVEEVVRLVGRVLRDVEMPESEKTRHAD